MKINVLAYKCSLPPQASYFIEVNVRGGIFASTVNPVLLAAATNTVVCSRNEDENAKVGVRL